jgi:hypothetical protein
VIIPPPFFLKIPSIYPSTNQPSIQGIQQTYSYHVTSTHRYVYIIERGASLHPALLSVYDKTGLLPFAKGLKEAGFRLLGSGGTARQIRDAGIEIELVATDGIVMYSN